MIVDRLHEVRSLYNILPQGSSGGKEFARIIDMLLFYEAKRRGGKITIFNDAAGDYQGLDSFEGDVYRKQGTIGYQYKFYPSPLSTDHRNNIEKSLKKAVLADRNKKLHKWILVTPDDLIESGTRKDKGDVTWFENLRDKFSISFEIEHWGHKKIIALFLESNNLCLRYYPELISDGKKRKETIQETQEKYCDNILSLYKNIEFVGMSIYKPEATKGISMENIYIPLSVIPERANDDNSDIERINPRNFLHINNKTVILGDPGSGKSTLLKYLALCGISKPIQERYNTKSDDRLPIFITLRRYADELKSRRNLSLIDYIYENIQGDFSLRSLNLEFLEYFLGTGQAILLFDGLDELPNSSFKQLIRNRIKSFCTTYPGNTTIVSSRIVGYENSFRFDEREFIHYKITKLQLPEIEKFVHDWYQFRVENEHDRKANIEDLIRIMRDKDHTSIRELGENPLLLTIVTLVHRIDAVLPDERVVLYQKCTETLLNTWHTWKYRDIAGKSKGRIERRNKRRMEAIAYWMQNNSSLTGKLQRSVVPYNDLLRFLINYIDTTEGINDPDSDTEDIAVDFLDFVRQKAGLLIEVGDQAFSFVHLTFQEYLTSSYLITISEKNGVSSIWDDLRKLCADIKWYEVIRLLVAGFKSEDTQDFIVEGIINEIDKGNKYISPMILGGFLIDGVSAAETRKNDIIYQLIIFALNLKTTNEIQSVISLFNRLILRDISYKESVENNFNLILENKKYENDTSIILLSFILDIKNPYSLKLIKKLMKNNEDIYIIDMLLFNKKINRVPRRIINKFNLLWSIQNTYALASPTLNLISSTLQALGDRISTLVSVKRSFEILLLTLQEGTIYGPFSDFIFNSFQIALNTDNSSEIERIISDISSSGPKRFNHSSKPKYPSSMLNINNAMNRIFKGYINDSIDDLDDSMDDPDIDVRQERIIRKRRVSAFNKSINRTKKIYSKVDIDSKFIDEIIENTKSLRINRDIDNSISNRWITLINSSQIYEYLLSTICEVFQLNPRHLWYEAIHMRFIPNIPSYMSIYNPKLWKNAEFNIVNNSFKEEDLYIAAWIVIFTCWLDIFYPEIDQSIFMNIIEITKYSDHPAIKIAQCIRDITKGDTEKTIDISEMLESSDINYKSIFTNAVW